MSQSLPGVLPPLEGAVGGSSAGYRFSLTDLSRFDAAMAHATQLAGQQPGAAQASSAGGASASAASTLPASVAETGSAALESLMQPFEHISAEAAELSRRADAAAASGHTLTPGEMIMLTVRCQEFMFHCQLTSNVANRTSDGLQQLFRQQS